MGVTPTDLFREWLARKIKTRGLSHTQLALLSGVDRSTVGRLLAGDRSPSLDTAVRLVGALDDEALPTVLARLGRRANHPTRVAQALSEDPQLSETAEARLMRCYRELRSPSAASESP